MKRATIIGVIGFLLGAATSPKAANQDETLKLLCQRWKALDGDIYINTKWPQRDGAVQFMGTLFCSEK